MKIAVRRETRLCKGFGMQIYGFFCFVVKNKLKV